MKRKGDSEQRIQRVRMLVNALWLTERREAHTSHGWDTSEA